MRRIVANSWWLVGVMLLGAVLTVGLLIRSSDQAHRQVQQRAVQHEVTQALAGSVGDVLSRERALARVIGTSRSLTAVPWSVLSNIVTGQSAAYSAGFVEPVTQRERARFQRRTGVRIYNSPSTGVIRPAAPRPLHLVLVESSDKTPKASLIGLDLASSPIRARVMLEAARTGRQLATPPVRFLGPGASRYGVGVYAPVRNRRGQLLGWVTASYRARALADMATAHLGGVRLTITDGRTVLYSDDAHPSGTPAVLTVAGRRWRIWARPATATSPATSWVIFGLGLLLAMLVSMTLRLAATRESYAMRIVAEREAEEVALARIATVVAERGDPKALFALVAEQMGELFESLTAAVSRFEARENKALVVGYWTSGPVDMASSSFALDGPTASARVFREGHVARTDAYQISADPITSSLGRAGARAGIAAPIRVGGELWGAIGAAYETEMVPVGAEERLERFASLVALAISNADAWDRLASQASTDALTGLANRRAFDTHLATECRRVQRYARDLSVALLDIDHFKEINDRFGHPAGDKVLVRLAEILSENARDVDLVARVGGEEFAWIMPETDDAGAFSAVERMREAFAAEAFPGIGCATVSVGLRMVTDTSNRESVMRDADRALYAAKAGGRNATVVYAEDPQVILATEI